MIPVDSALSITYYVSKSVISFWNILLLNKNCDTFGTFLQYLIHSIKLTVSTTLLHFPEEGLLGPSDIFSNPLCIQEVSHAAGHRMSYHLINPH